MLLPVEVHNRFSDISLDVRNNRRQPESSVDDSRGREHIQLLVHQQRNPHPYLEQSANFESPRRHPSSNREAHHNQEHQLQSPIIGHSNNHVPTQRSIEVDGSNIQLVREDPPVSSSSQRISSSGSVPFAFDERLLCPVMNLGYNNSPPHSPFPSSAGSSLFTISQQDALALVRSVKKNDDSRHCYFIHLKLQPLFNEDVIPGTSLRKLPRIINGIPLGPGFLSRDQICEIKWRLIEGGHSVMTFISSPLLRQEAEESKSCLKERLMKQAQAVFGDLIVKVGVVLSRCLDFDDDFTLNDIAVQFGEGLHFRD